MGAGRRKIRSDQDRPVRKFRAKFVRTAGEPRPLFSGVLCSDQPIFGRHEHVVPEEMTTGRPAHGGGRPRNSDKKTRRDRSRGPQASSRARAAQFQRPWSTGAELSMTLLDSRVGRVHRQGTPRGRATRRLSIQRSLISSLLRPRLEPRTLGVSLPIAKVFCPYP